MESIDLVEAIRSSHITERVFEYTPARGSQGDLTFNADGTVVGGGLATWRVGYGTYQVPTLYLNDSEGNLQTALLLTPQGYWKGRARDSKGMCTCRSKMPDQRSWVLYSNPITYYRSQTVKAPVSVVDADDFKYLEDLGPQINWSEYDYDLSALINKGTLVQSSTAIALIAWNRVAYFTRMVESLAQNPEAHQMPIFLFIDKSDVQEDIEAQVAICREHLPHTVVIRRPRNYGCGRNIIDARVQLFANMEYDKVFVFEDDMTITPQYLRLCLNMWDWAQENYSNVGVVQGWNKCIMSYDGKVRAQAEVQPTYTNWWGYLQGRESWSAMEPAILQYQQMFLGGDYRARPHRTINQWWKRMMREPVKIVGESRYTLDDTGWDENRRYFEGVPPSGQDAVSMHTLEHQGYVRLCTTVNRGFYIGQNGIHMNPRMYVKDGFEHVKLDEMTGDSTRLEFITRGNEPLVLPTKPGIPGNQHIESL